MKTLARLGGLFLFACIACNGLRATSYLVSIQAENNQYLCAEGGGGGNVVANRYYVGSWETFVIDDSYAVNGYTISIKSTENPKYLCMDNQQIDGWWPNLFYRVPPAMLFNRDYVGAWEKFHLVDPWSAGTPKPLSSGWINSKIFNLYSYIRAVNGGGGAVDALGGDNTTLLGLAGFTGTRFKITVLAVLEP